MTAWDFRIAKRHRASLVTFFPIVLLLGLIVFFPPDGREGARWIQFIGRFHPLAVHFPIALILLVPIMELVGRGARSSYLRLSSEFVLGLATIGATVAVFLGWCSARAGSYSGSLVTQHMWGGITLAGVCWLCWILRSRTSELAPGRFYTAALAMGVFVVSFTGYRGGQISQGEDHLTEYMPSILRHMIGLPDNDRTVEADAGSFYAVRVQPILTERCVTCHGPAKQAGELRLDSYGRLTKGGKHGAVVKAANIPGSDLVRRITLSPDQDDFMPKEKKQPLSPDQVKLIELWIAAGASGTLSVDAIKDLPAKDSVAAAPIEVSFPEIDSTAVMKARQDIASAVARLQNQFPNILNYESRGSADLVLNASLLGLKFGDNDLEQFGPVAEHITVADFSRTAVTDRAAPSIAAMKRLHVLRLAQTQVTDTILKALNGFSELQSLNVYGTRVTAAALPLLGKLPKLEHFYAGQTAIPSSVSVPRGLRGKLVL